MPAPRHRITQREFEAELAKFIRAGATPDTMEAATGLQAELASPGDWEAARYLPSDDPSDAVTDTVSE